MIRSRSQQVHRLQIEVVRHNKNSDPRDAICYPVTAKRADYASSYPKTVVTSQIQISVVHISLPSQMKQLSWSHVSNYLMMMMTMIETEKREELRAIFHTEQSRKWQIESCWILIERIWSMMTVIVSIHLDSCRRISVIQRLQVQLLRTAVIVHAAILFFLEMMWLCNSMTPRL